MCTHPLPSVFRRSVLVLGLAPALAWAAPADEAAALAALRAGGVVVLMRHGQTTPGVGDPAGWRLEDCSTQRNLDDAGRAQVRRVGEWFRRHGIAPDQVRNSPWCRTRETAQLAFGRSQDWPALANLFGNRTVEPAHNEQWRRFLATRPEGGVTVLVSHGSTISAFTGVYLGQGEAVIVRRGAVRDGQAEPVVAARLSVP